MVDFAKSEGRLVRAACFAFAAMLMSASVALSATGDKAFAGDGELTAGSVAFVSQDGEGDFSVQLNYDPPIAGDIALFQANTIDTKHDADLSELDYVWEMSEDDGKTWVELAEQYQGKPTLSILTNPIDENASSSSDDGGLIYIRVRVVETTGMKRVRISNAQPLTVHVGDDKNNDAPKLVSVTKSVAKAKVSFSKLAYTGNTLKPKMTVKMGDKKLVKGADYTVAYKNAKDENVAAKNLKAAGKYKAVIKGKGAYFGKKTVPFTVAKAKNTLFVKAKSVKLKQGKVQSGAVRVPAKGAYSVSGAKGKVTYKKLGGSSRLKVNAKTGDVTVAKGTTKGTYSAKVKVAAAGTANYKAASKTVTVKVTVAAPAKKTVRVKTATYAFDLPAELYGKVRIQYVNDGYYTVNVYATDLAESGGTPILTTIKGFYTSATGCFSHPAGQNFAMIDHAGLSWAVGYNVRTETSMPATTYSDKGEWLRLHNACVSSAKKTLEIYRPSNA